MLRKKITLNVKVEADTEPSASDSFVAQPIIHIFNHLNGVQSQLIRIIGILLYTYLVHLNTTSIHESILQNTE